MQRRNRPTARVLVIDEEDCVLLIRVDDPMTTAPAHWIAPGGGVNANESFAEAAARELFEETALRVEAAALQGPVAVSVDDWDFRGIPFHSETQYFTHSTARFEPDDIGWDAIEFEIHTGWRWWSVDELERSEEAVIPEGLPGLLRRLANGGPTGTPVELGAGGGPAEASSA